MNNTNNHNLRFGFINIKMDIVWKYFGMGNPYIIIFNFIKVKNFVHDRTLKEFLKAFQEASTAQDGIAPNPDAYQ